MWVIVLTFCAFTTSKGSNAMTNAGFYFKSAGFCWWSFTSVSPTCCLIPATYWFLHQRSLKAVFSSFSHSFFHLYCFTSLLYALPLTLTVLFMLRHISKSLSSFTLWNFPRNYALIIDENNRVIVTENREVKKPCICRNKKLTKTSPENCRIDWCAYQNAVKYGFTHHWKAFKNQNADM